MSTTQMVKQKKIHNCGLVESFAALDQSLLCYAGVIFKKLHKSNPRCHLRWYIVLHQKALQIVLYSIVISTETVLPTFLYNFFFKILYAIGFRRKNAKPQS